MKILVTNTLYETFPTIYKVQGHLLYTVAAKPHQAITDQNILIEKSLGNTFLDDRIIVSLFFQYLSEASYSLACDLLSLSKHHTKLLFRYMFALNYRNRCMYYRYSDLSFDTMIMEFHQDAARTLKLLDYTVSSYCHGLYPHEHDFAHIKGTVVDEHNIFPWSVTDLIFTTSLNTTDNHKIVKYGHSMDKTVFIKSISSAGGIIDCSFFRTPVVSFHLQNNQNEDIALKEIFSSDTWVAFTNLLKLFFGPDTGVLHMILDHFSGKNRLLEIFKVLK